MKTKKLLSFILIMCLASMGFISTIMVSAQTIESADNQAAQVVLEMEDSAKQNRELDEDKLIEFVIKNEKDFSKFMTTAKYWKNYYKIKLTRNINMKSKKFNSIENFYGQFDGCGHTIENISFKCFVENNHGTISNIKFNSSKLVNDSVCGLVENNEENGVIDNCVVNMNSENANIKAGFVCTNKGKLTNSETTLIVKSQNDNIGGFVSENHGTIEKCTVKGNVTGHNNVGGFVGQNWGTITDCNTKGNVKGDNKVGGFSGKNYGTIEKCTTIGSTTIDYEFGGGFVGYNDKGTITNCYAEGEVKGYVYIGGFVGENDFGAITNCAAKGNVNGHCYVGGFVGQNWHGTINNCTATGSNKSETSYIGGFVGLNLEGIITNCNAEVSVKSQNYHDLSYNVGGFVGENYYGTITNCVAKEDVTGNDMVGGFVGGNQGVIENCISIGYVIGNDKVGGFVGYNKGCSCDESCARISECIFEGTVNGEKIDLDKFVGKNEEGKIEDCKIA